MKFNRLYTLLENVFQPIDKEEHSERRKIYSTDGSFKMTLDEFFVWYTGDNNWYNDWQTTNSMTYNQKHMQDAYPNENTQVEILNVWHKKYGNEEIDFTFVHEPTMDDYTFAFELDNNKYDIVGMGLPDKVIDKRLHQNEEYVDGYWKGDLKDGYPSDRVDSDNKMSFPWQNDSKNSPSPSQKLHQLIDAEYEELQHLDKASFYDYAKANIPNIQDDEIEDAWKFVIGESIKEDLLPGGEGDGLMPQDLADKHGVSLEQLELQIRLGLEEEMEHTKDKDVAMEIVMDHLNSDPNYYTHLSKMEKDVENEVQ